MDGQHSYHLEYIDVRFSMSGYFLHLTVAVRLIPYLKVSKVLILSFILDASET